MYDSLSNGSSSQLLQHALPSACHKIMASASVCKHSSCTQPTCLEASSKNSGNRDCSKDSARYH
eukprot:3793193-Amphidinium_carterae.1